jgi:prepilin-type N-terminal cleavage/methylation domain-containing protein
MKNSNFPKAFSLLELSIVLSVVGILATLAINATSIITRLKFSTARSITENSPIPKIDGLIAWYETTTNSSFETGAVLDSYADDAITQWKWYDRSPNSLALRNNTTSQMLSPTGASASVSYQQKALAQLPSFRFQGNGGLFFSPLRINPPATSISNATVFMVLQPVVFNAATTYTIFDSGSGSNKNLVSISTSGAIIDRGSAVSISSSGRFASGKAAIVAVYLSNNSSIYVNSNNTPLGGSAVSAGSNNISGIYIAKSAQGSGNDFNGFISEVAVYNSALKFSDRREVLNYLSKKYKIAVEGI